MSEGQPAEKSILIPEPKKRESALRFVPVLAAMIAAISAAASGFSSYYAYKGQTAALRSSVFTAQFETASAVGSDISEILQSHNAMLENFKDTLPLLATWLAYQAGTQKMTELQVQNHRGRMDFLKREGVSSSELADKALSSLNRDLIRFGLLFPEELMTRLTGVLKKVADLNPTVQKMQTITSKMADAVFDRNMPALNSGPEQIAQLESIVVAWEKGIDDVSSEMKISFQNVSDYLNIEQVERDLRGSRPTIIKTIPAPK